MDIVNEKWKTLLLGDCMSTLKQNNFQIPLIIGRDLNGKDVVEDLVQISNRKEKSVKHIYSRHNLQFKSRRSENDIDRYKNNSFNRRLM